MILVDVKKGVAMAFLCFGMYGGLVLQAQEKPEKPRNVILMIGDGMGLSQLSSTYYFMEEEGEPAFSRFKYIGLARTSAGSAPVTQSPAAATAMSTGYKTYNMAVGVDLFEKHGIQINYFQLKKVKKPRPGDRYGFLLAPDRMPAMYEGRKDFLSKSSSIAIDFLSTGENGYFLMIEGSQIDWAGHGNQAEYMILEMNDFEQTVKRVMDYAEADGETLVIVTADHETGGFTLGAAGDNGYEADYTIIHPTFASSNHSATLVPVLAFGPGAENFTGIYENTEFFHKLVSLFNLN